MCRRNGVELLADDTTEIDVLPHGWLQVLPSESAVWLTREGPEAKVPVRSCPVSKQPAALRCIVSLVFDDAARGLEVREIRGESAVAALLPSLVRFERTSALWARELAFMAQLVSQSRVVEARRSHDVAADTVAEALLELLVEKAR
jgi:hypothetical protein